MGRASQSGFTAARGRCAQSAANVQCAEQCLKIAALNARARSALRDAGVSAVSRALIAISNIAVGTHGHKDPCALPDRRFQSRAQVASARKRLSSGVRVADQISFIFFRAQSEFLRHQVA